MSETRGECLNLTFAVPPSCRSSSACRRPCLTVRPSLRPRPLPSSPPGPSSSFATFLSGAASFFAKGTKAEDSASFGPPAIGAAPSRIEDGPSHDLHRLAEGTTSSATAYDTFQSWPMSPDSRSKTTQSAAISRSTRRSNRNRGWRCSCPRDPLVAQRVLHEATSVVEGGERPARARTSRCRNERRVQFGASCRNQSCVGLAHVRLRGFSVMFVWTGVRFDSPRLLSSIQTTVSCLMPWIFRLLQCRRRRSPWMTSYLSSAARPVRSGNSTPSATVPVPDTPDTSRLSLGRTGANPHFFATLG